MAAKKKKHKPIPTTGEDGKVGRIERKRGTENLPVQIDDETRHKMADTLASVVAERARFLERHKADMMRDREQRAYFDTRIEELGDQVHRHVEIKSVEVVEMLIASEKRVEIIRTDTGAIIKHRPAAPADLQESLMPSSALEGPPPNKRGRKAKPAPEDAPPPPFGADPKPAGDLEPPDLPE